jgi:predicted membrane-bound dolichyl-phosphate-mannose-protein mannosyltransferase
MLEIAKNPTLMVAMFMFFQQKLLKQKVQEKECTWAWFCWEGLFLLIFRKLA